MRSLSFLYQLLAAILPINLLRKLPLVRGILSQQQKCLMLWDTKCWDTVCANFNACQENFENTTGAFSFPVASSMGKFQGLHIVTNTLHANAFKSGRSGSFGVEYFSTVPSDSEGEYIFTCLLSL